MWRTRPCVAIFACDKFLTADNALPSFFDVFERFAIFVCSAIRRAGQSLDSTRSLKFFTANDACKNFLFQMSSVFASMISAAFHLQILDIIIVFVAADVVNVEVKRNFSTIITPNRLMYPRIFIVISAFFVLIKNKPVKTLVHIVDDLNTRRICQRSFQSVNRQTFKIVFGGGAQNFNRGNYFSCHPHCNQPFLTCTRSADTMPMAHSSPVPKVIISKKTLAHSRLWVKLFFYSSSKPANVTLTAVGIAT